MIWAVDVRVRFRLGTKAMGEGKGMGGHMGKSMGRDNQEGCVEGEGRFGREGGYAGEDLDN